MLKFALVRPDGTPRILIVCDDCANRAITQCVSKEMKFWFRDYDGPQECEGCLIVAEIQEAG